MRAPKTPKKQGGWVGGALMAGAALYGASQQNSANANLNSKNRAFNADQARLNREYQHQMSSTAVRRRVLDMKQAGINPILAAGDGATGTGGAQATAAGANTPMQDEITPAANTGLTARLMSSQINKLQAETDRIEAMTPSAAGIQNHIDAIKKHFPQVFKDMGLDKFDNQAGATTSAKDTKDTEKYTEQKRFGKDMRAYKKIGGLPYQNPKSNNPSYYDNRK